MLSSDTLWKSFHILSVKKPTVAQFQKGERIPQMSQEETDVGSLKVRLLQHCSPIQTTLSAIHTGVEAGEFVSCSYFFMHNSSSESSIFIS